MRTFEGRTALVTGGSRGIGLGIAKGLVDRGAKVVLTARKPDALAEAVAEQAPAAVDVDALETNIVVLSTGDRPAAPVAAAAAEQGVLVSALGPRMVRVVTHLDVSAEDCTSAGKVLGALLAG